MFCRNCSVCKGICLLSLFFYERPWKLFEHEPVIYQGVPLIVPLLHNNRQNKCISCIFISGRRVCASLCISKYWWRYMVVSSTNSYVISKKKSMKTLRHVQSFVIWGALFCLTCKGVDYGSRNLSLGRVSSVCGVCIVSLPISMSQRSYVFVFIQLSESVCRLILVLYPVPEVSFTKPCLALKRKRMNYVSPSPWM
jgi:hypothetical protein